jgi:hypothetical protein
MKLSWLPCAIAVAVAGLLSACHGQGSSSPLAATVAYDQHIKAIVDQKCLSCHATGGVAPFPLETFDQVSQYAKASLAAIEAGTMPPWAAKRECRTYYGDYSLTADEKAMFRSWVMSGAKQSLEDKPAYTPPPLDTPKLSRVDLTLQNSQPYQPVPAPDETRCFVIDWPYKEVKYITGNDVVPGDKSLVHHASIYIAPQADRDFYRARDEASGAKDDGYPCSATMGVGKSSARWIGGWLPGLSGFEFPLHAGMRIEPESVVILQVHYFKADHSTHAHLHDSAAVAPDQTKILLKIEDEVDLVGTLVTFTNPDWMVELEMDIPAGAKSVKHEFAGQIDHIPRLIGQDFPLQGEEFDVQSINMHGHALMKGAHMKIIREDQSEECMLDIDNFSPNWQLNYIFKEPAKVTRRDQVYIRCEWDNSPENQMVVDGERLPSIPVNWGDGARSEMCFGLMFVTERPQ